VLQLKAGLVYDTRDHDSDPTRGVNIEATLVGAPDIIDNEGYSNLGFTLVGSHYVPVWKDRLTFAYRLGVQANIAGEIPYYFINNLNTLFFRKFYTEGLGGNASVRGINRNGVVGNGMAWLKCRTTLAFRELPLHQSEFPPCTESILRYGSGNPILSFG
jgi:outer membrane protein assembly factor BamA